MILSLSLLRVYSGLFLILVSFYLSFQNTTPMIIIINTKLATISMIFVVISFSSYACSFFCPSSRNVSLFFFASS